MSSKITDEIYNLVKMEDVLRQYGFSPGRAGRIPCPLHGGKDRNFSYTKEVYHCWTCGARGNVISFVMKYFGLTFGQAITRINNDFNLGLDMIGKKPNRREREDMRLDARMREVCREHDRKEWEHFRKMSTAYRILFRLSLKKQIEGLPGYLNELDDYLNRFMARKEGERG